MAEESFLLVSLEEQKSKKLAEVISNDTCRKMLEYLSKKGKAETTETELSEELKIPLSTVHYNLKNLVEAKLVVADEYHYSKRGKEILHYKLANKLIIITPQGAETSKFAEIMKKYLPVSAVIIAAGIIVDLMQKYFYGTASQAATKSMAFTATESLQDTIPEASRLMAAAPANIPQAAFLEPNIAAWFVLGAFAGLLLLLVWELIRKRKK